jgi:ferric-dicitrate binding protein FerR (iron transport regulator)
MGIAVAGTLLWNALATRSRHVAQADSHRVYRTEPGQQAVVHLLDGTKVTLSAGGKLVVPAAFNGQSRDVELDGQAFFEVAKDRELPFRVHTGNVVTRVLGTAFNVRGYSGEPRVQVVVASGRVSVSPAGSAQVSLPPVTELGPGDLAQVSRDGSVYVEHHVDLDRYLAWRDGWLTFIDAPVVEILAELERWMGVHFTLADSSIGAQVLTTRIRPGAIQSTLAVLEAGLNVRAIQADSGIRLEKR